MASKLMNTSPFIGKDLSTYLQSPARAQRAQDSIPTGTISRAGGPAPASNHIGRGLGEHFRQERKERSNRALRLEFRYKSQYDWKEDVHYDDYTNIYGKREEFVAKSTRLLRPPQHKAREHRL